MAAADYTDLVAGQREYFHSRATRPAGWRRQQLEAMKALLADNRDRFFAALDQDLRRNDTDSDLMDVEFCIKRGRVRPPAPAQAASELERMVVQIQCAGRR